MVFEKPYQQTPKKKNQFKNYHKSKTEHIFCNMIISKTIPYKCKHHTFVCL